ncbi:hypothetical protein [Paracoccus aestuariivivens]|uniref:Uncharacterized protein n=1 Tax=Paracoccus aestuariivivens TaxID=1820333 RepID=A0A6L6JFX4_9RHOB|nr:hypothetical protein [Paracoccus aestuariivivens]MTH79004.1 hypothetical protein [Paracoccus aestuariivivens]
MPVEIIGEVHPALFSELSAVHYRGVKVAVLNARGEVLVNAEKLTPPTITAQPTILPLTATLGDSITLTLGAATGLPVPVANWDFTLNGVSIKSRLDQGMMTMELADPGEYLLSVDWTNTQDSVRAETAVLTVAAPVIPVIDYAAVTLAYLDAASTFAGTQTDVTSISPIGQGKFVFSRTGSGNAIQHGETGFTFSGGYYLQTQVLSGLATTDGMFAVADLTINSYGAYSGQLLDGTGTTLKLRNSSGTLQAVGPVSGMGALSLGATPYGARIIISGQIDDVLDVLSGHDVSGGLVSVAHTGLTDPAPTRFITGRYLNGTLHRLAIVGRPEGQNWPITMPEVVADFRRGA